MSGLLVALERWILERGRFLAGAVLLVTLVCGLGYGRLGWTQSPEVITLQGSDELELYRDYVQRWGSDELIVLAYPVDDAFDAAVLSQLRALTDALFEVDGVQWVSSLDTAFVVDTGPFGPFARPLVPDAIDAASTATVRAQALASPFVAGSLVAPDARVLLLAVQLEGGELDNAAIEERALAGVDAVLARPEFAGLDVHRAGSPVFNRELSRLNQRDNAVFTPLAVAILALALYVLFRSLWPVALALGVVGLSVVWTLGAMGLLGVPMNITTSLLPPLLMVIAVADSVHMITAYVSRLARGDTREAALRFTLREILPSCFFTSLTTVVGFSSLLLVRIESVRTFALFAVLGVVVAFVHAATVLPALLVRAPIVPSSRRLPSGLELSWAARAARRPIFALALLALFAGVAAAGLGRVRVSTHDGEFFAQSNPINRAYRFIESHLEGVTPFEVELRAPREGDLRAPAGVRALARLQETLGRRPELSAGTSLADLLRATTPGLDLADDAEVERAVFLLGTLAPEEMGRYVSADGRLARISARAVAMSSARSEALVSDLEDASRLLVPEAWSASFTGLVPVFSQMEQYLVEGQLESYGVATLLIGSLLWLLFRSLPVVACALVANLAPIAAVGGVMGLSGMRLDVATIMVASIALGIVVDDTIHLLRGFRRGLERGLDAGAALDHALSIAGRPIVLTSVVLTAGFGSLALSDFQPTAHFGMLVGLAMLSALAADLLILPAALLHWAPARRAGSSSGSTGRGPLHDSPSAVAATSQETGR